MIKDLSFERFNEKELEEFIRTVPKSVLVTPIVHEQKYKNKVGIKGFRSESIRKDILVPIYVKDINNNKSASLSKYILRYIDGAIKDCLNHDDYQLLCDDSDNKEKKRVLQILINDELMKEKYLYKFLNIEMNDEDKKLLSLLEEVDRLNKAYNDEIEYGKKLQDDIDHLENEKNDYLSKIYDLNNELNEIKETYHIDFNTLLNQMTLDLSQRDDYDIHILLNQLHSSSLEELLNKINEYKKTTNDYKSLKKLIVLEYILVSLSEVQ